MFKKLFQRQKRARLPNMIATVDIGSSKVACAMARMSLEGGTTILGAGHCGTLACKAGIISDMEALTGALLQAVHGAEAEAQETIREVYLNVSSPLLKSHLLTTGVPILGREISNQDVKALVLKALEGVSPTQEEALHVIPYVYKIDHNSGIKDPRGMYGEFLEAQIHLITAPLSPLRNLIACAERAHLEVVGLVASPFASALACVEEDEMELGTIVFDIGAHTTGMAIFSHGNLVFVDSLKIGGGHLTSDLAHGLSTSLSHAERLKTLYGSALASSLTDRETIVIPQIGEKEEGGVKMPKSALIRIILPRVEEIFSLLKKRMEELLGRQRASYRVVLTGGTAQLPGFQEVASIILGQPTRLGFPLHSRGENDLIYTPSFACCVGQLDYIRRVYAEDYTDFPSETRFKAMTGTLRSWLKEKI